MAEPIIKLEDVHKTYSMGSVDVHALRGANLCVEEGEFLAIVGPSGSGKSTLLHIMGCLDRPSSGVALFRGKSIGDLRDRELAQLRNRDLGFVFQSFNLLPEETALENVALPLVYRRDRDRRRKAAAALEEVGLGHRMHHRPGELSGGEQQRVAIARALVKEPKVILADEPTGNLDTKNGGAIMQILREVNRHGMTVIIITHDPETAASCPRTVFIRDGVVAENPAAVGLTASARIIKASEAPGGPGLRAEGAGGSPGGAPDRLGAPGP